MAEKWHVATPTSTGSAREAGSSVTSSVRAMTPEPTTAVEVKWGVHPAGEGRDGWATDEQRTTLLILVRGRFRLDLSVASTTLEKEGDYAVWGPGIDHSWQAEEDSVVITVRWPSIPSS